MVADLKTTAHDFDNATQEIFNFIEDRRTLLSKMKIEVNKLSQKKVQLREKVDVLEKVPVEAMRHFEEALKNENKSNAKRDILFLMIGIGGGGLLNVILKLMGIG